MKPYLLFCLFLFTACAPVSQTVSNVSNFVAGTQVVSYSASPESLASAIQTMTPTMALYDGYTPLSVSDTATNQLTLSAKALQGSINSNINAEDFSVTVTLEPKGDYTEVILSPSSASNDTARKVAADYVAKLDEQFGRYTAPQ
jgi:hypothetical protein